MGMYMSVQEIARFIFIDKPAKYSKAAVAEIFSIMNKPWRGMGNYNVDASIAPEAKTHSLYNMLHLFFRVLIYSSIVPP
jgi:hypothetical protein